jgi:hypothetical protein
MAPKFLVSCTSKAGNPVAAACGGVVAERIRQKSRKPTIVTAESTGGRQCDDGIQSPEAGRAIPRP